METQEIRYFRIGSFILIGLILLISGILVLGSGKLFKRTVFIETYFNESVQGLSIGSPVKYRGLDIGHVKKISFVNEVYDLPETDKVYTRYIYVGMEITSSFLINSADHKGNTMLQKYIHDGLRIKLSQQGLTGNAYLELNFEDPKKAVPLKIDWNPQYPYIPSATSTLTKFSDNVQHILDQLQTVHFKKIFDHIDQLATSSDRVAQKTSKLMNHINIQLMNMMNNLDGMSTNLRSLSEQAKHFPSQVLFGQAPPRLNPEALGVRH